MRFLLSKLRIFLFFPIPYLSQPLYHLWANSSSIISIVRRKPSCMEIVGFQPKALSFWVDIFM